jgi:hypothetical protein
VKILGKRRFGGVFIFVGEFSFFVAVAVVVRLARLSPTADGA